MAAKSGILGLGSRLYPGNVQRIFNKDLTRFMQSLSRERQNRASKSKAPLAGCGLPNPIKKIAHRMEFLFFKTCPNCIGRSWNSSTESPERQLHSWTTMFATEHFRHPSLDKTIWIEKTRQARFLRYAYPCGINWNFNDSLYRPESVYDMLRNGEPEHLRMRWRDSSTKEKNAVPPDTGAGASYQTSHPGISARAIAFGRSWPFAAFCYRPCLPVRHWGRDMSAPKPYVTNPTPTHSSKPPLSI